MNYAEFIRPTALMYGDIANKMNAWMYFVNAQAYAKGDYRVWSSDWFKQ